MSETLEWKTDVMMSPTGAEQRRKLRDVPRAMYEFGVTVGFSERAFLDNMLDAYGAADWYAPVWHETSATTADVSIGATSVPVLTANTLFSVGTPVMLVGANAHTYEIFEVSSVSEAAVGLASGTTLAWPLGTTVVPAAKQRLTEQPRITELTDAVVTTQLRFMRVGNSDLWANGATLDTFAGNPVLTDRPEGDVSPRVSFDRLVAELDTGLSIPYRVDSAGRAFATRQMTWTLSGRSEHRQFEALLRTLAGKATPVWLPTFMQDFKLVEDLEADGDVLVVENAGYALSGGPRPTKKDILIETTSGRIYRTVEAASVDEQGRELLLLDSEIAEGLAVEDAVAISFMALSRMNQDSVEVEHHTDSSGTSTAILNFRHAPDLRSV